MGPTWNTKGNYLPKDLANVDWSKEYFSVSHPVRVITDGRRLIDYDSHVVIATLPPGYAWFFAHDHPHVCREDWDGATYPEGWD